MLPSSGACRIPFGAPRRVRLHWCAVQPAPIPPRPINLIGSTPFPRIALARTSTEGGHKVSVPSAGVPLNPCNRHFGHKPDKTPPYNTTPHCGQSSWFLGVLIQVKLKED